MNYQLVVFLVIILIYTLFHTTLTDLQFICLCVALCVLWWWIKYDVKQMKITEPFVTEETNNHRFTLINFSAYRNKLFELPQVAKGIIIPKLDYLIESITQSSSSENSRDKNDEFVYIDESEYMSKKDPDVVRNGEIDDDAMGNLRENYSAVDDILELLRNQATPVYDEMLKY